MKFAILNTHKAAPTFVPSASANMLEGAPHGVAKIKTGASVSITERPHILTRRAARWARRAAH